MNILLRVFKKKWYIEFLSSNKHLGTFFTENLRQTTQFTLILQSKGTKKVKPDENLKYQLNHKSRSFMYSGGDFQIFFFFYTNCKFLQLLISKGIELNINLIIFLAFLLNYEVRQKLRDRSESYIIYQLHEQSL